MKENSCLNVASKIKISLDELQIESSINRPLLDNLAEDKLSEHNLEGEYESVRSIAVVITSPGGSAVFHVRRDPSTVLIAVGKHIARAAPKRVRTAARIHLAASI